MVSLKIKLAGLPEYPASQEVHTFIGRRRLGRRYLQGQDKKQEQANDRYG
jgi:hypothetical protein